MEKNKTKNERKRVVGVVLSNDIRQRIIEIAKLEDRTVSYIGGILIKKGLKNYNPDYDKNNNKVLA